MTSNFAFLKRLYNAFDPFRPLPAGDPAYVDCTDVRGDGDILEAVGREILYSDRKTCQLYAGHRGAGKSTELLRLQKYLDENGFFVVYFAADEQDIDPEDVQYTDILLACTRNILTAFKDRTDSQAVLNWLKERCEDLKDLLQTKIFIDELSIEAQVSQFAKITTKIRSEPSERQKIRQLIDPHTTTLIEALNEFIRDAKKNLLSKYSELVLIADSLDRIVPIIQADGRSNHDEIFIDRNEQLKNLDCHLVYTIPISLLYSDRAASLTEIYGLPQVLPMIMVKTPENEPFSPGLDKVIEILQKRLKKVDPNKSIVDLFESRSSLEMLCLMSGGHARNLLLLMKEALKYTTSLPITDKALQRSISELRKTYKDTIYANEWKDLANVHYSKEIVNDQLHRGLLFNRCILEYRYLESEGGSNVWYDIHPLIKGIKTFQDAYNQLYPG
ncbi:MULTISPECIES: AAA family ATPase [unclassified Dolichospermum]|uniref:AAA family ATPase n=1 Tax=unclassified Dolichospermum TaxID=2622029 RepID=UPI001446B4FA|nr:MULTISPECIES: AAA family ATPase [unclassified Dolichospermum]MTJ15858.1 ATP-binding protein [Dolichospermum sp. UHCC 0299]MTJ38047.1 ATP-binding protein [Dolichospermum sp. UHCC 0406]